MTVHELRFDLLDLTTVDGVYDVAEDADSALIVATGWTPESGFIVEVLGRQLDPDQVLRLAAALRRAGEQCQRWAS